MYLYMCVYVCMYIYIYRTLYIYVQNSIYIYIKVYIYHIPNTHTHTHTHNGILLSHKKKNEIFAICRNMDGLKGHYPK